MLRFVVHDASRLGAPHAVEDAYLSGGDAVAVPASIEVEDGLISCSKRSSDPAALHILYDAEQAGQLSLQTCLLPERDQPYELVLELVRSRLRQFLTKLEDWMLFELDDGHPAIELAESAKADFIRAVTVGGGPEAERIAHGALVKAIEAGEMLALHHAELLLSRRLQSPVAPRTTMGCSVHPKQWSERLKSVVSSHFDYLCMPIRWRDLEPEEGEYAWGATDRWIEWAVRTGRKPVMAGPILDLSRVAVPDWLYIWEHDYETLRELIAEHIRAVVSRYRRVIQVWNVASGINLNGNFTLTFEQMMDLTRVALMLVRKLQPNARIMLEVAQPFPEPGVAERQWLPPLMYLEMVLEANMPVDSFGVRLQIGQRQGGRAARDLLEISHALDRFARLEHPVMVTACGAPSEPIAFDPAGPEPDEAHLAALNGSARTGPAGYWHASWSESVQTEWLTQAVTIALSKPYIESVCWQELYDHAESDMPGGGLINAMGVVKPSLRRVGQIRACLQTKQLPRDAERVTVGGEDAPVGTAPPPQAT
jgi:hypothetical protein